MTQLPLSVLPAAVPAADTAGLTTGATATTTEGGDAESVFASLLSAMQTAESTDTEAADALGAGLLQDAPETTTDPTEADGEIPSGLAALVQSLIVPRAALTVAETNGGGTAPSEATTLPLSTAGVAVPVEDATAALTAPLQPAPAQAAAPVLGAGTALPAAEAAPTPQTPTVAGDPQGAAVAVPTETAPATTDPIDATPAVETVEIEGTTEAAEPPTADATVTPETDLPAGDAADTQRPAPTDDRQAEPAARSAEADATAADAAASDAAAGDAASDTNPGDQRTDERPSTNPALRQDTGETSNQTQPATSAAPADASVAAPAAPATPLRTGTERPRAPVAASADITANATVAATETAAPTNVERTDAPVTIERITLRELPTVVVDRIRAIDPQGGVNRAVVRLDPPELGRIMLEVVSNGDEISVIARADNADAVRALIRQRAEIEAAVEALGLSISDFDVKQGDSERQEAEQEARRDGRFDDRRPAADTGYTTTDTPTTEGELFL